MTADAMPDVPTDAIPGVPTDAMPDVPPGEMAATPAARSLPLRMIDWYQRTFTGGPPTCRFYPSCSSYAREALEVHGTGRGLWLTARRLLRCRPFGPSGVDLVPERRHAHAERTTDASDAALTETPAPGPRNGSTSGKVA